MEDSEEKGEGRMNIKDKNKKKEPANKNKKIQPKSYPADIGRRMDIGKFTGRGGGIV